MFVNLQFKGKPVVIKFEDFIKKMPVFENKKNLVLIKKTSLQKKILENKNTIYIYIYDISKTNSNHVMLLEYSKNVKVAKIIMNYLSTDYEDFDFDDCYNHFNNEIFSSLDPDVKLLIPTNVKDFKELLRFSREYKIKKLENLLKSNQVQYMQNVIK